MKKLSLFLALTLLCLIGSTTVLAEETDYTQVPEGMLVGFINYSDTLDSGRMIHEGIEKWCEENGVELLVADADGDETNMMTICDNFILQGVDIIIDFNFNPAGGSALVFKCNTAGIPLISLDWLYEGENSYYVGIDNNEAGLVGGEAAVKYVEKKFGGEVEYVVSSYSGSLEDINVRTTNAVTALREAGYDIPDENCFTLECGTGDATQLAREQMTDWLTAHPEGKMVCVAGNDEIALGFHSAIESQNRGDDCILVSHCCEIPSQTAIKNGDTVWLATVDYMQSNYAETCMPLAVRLVNGEKVEDVYSYVHPRFIDADNIYEFYPDA